MDEITLNRRTLLKTASAGLLSEPSQGVGIADNGPPAAGVPPPDVPSAFIQVKA
jgi:hypothetical protein